MWCVNYSYVEQLNDKPITNNDNFSRHSTIDIKRSNKKLKSRGIKLELLVFFLLVCLYNLCCHQFKIMGCKTVFVTLMVTSNQKTYNGYTKNKKQDTKFYHQRESPPLGEGRKIRP